MRIVYLMLTLLSFQAIALEDKDFVKTYDLNKNHYYLSTGFKNYEHFNHFSVKAGTFFQACNDNGLQPWVIKHGEVVPQLLWEDGSKYINCSSIQQVNNNTYQLSKDEVLFNPFPTNDIFVTDGTTQGTRIFNEFELIKESIGTFKDPVEIPQNILKIGNDNYLYSLPDGNYLFNITTKKSHKFHNLERFYNQRECSLWGSSVVCILEGKLYISDGTVNGTRLIYESDDEDRYNFADTNKQDEFVTLTLLGEQSKLIKINIETGEKHTLYEASEKWFLSKKIIHTNDASFFVALAISSLNESELTYNLFKYSNQTKKSDFIYRDKVENYWGDLSIYYIKDQLLIKGNSNPHSNNPDDFFSLSSDNTLSEIKLPANENQVGYINQTDDEIYFYCASNGEHIKAYSPETMTFSDTFFSQINYISQSFVHDNKLFVDKILKEASYGNGLHIFNNITKTFDYVSSVEKGTHTVSSDIRFSSINNSDIFAYGWLDEEIKPLEKLGFNERNGNHVFFKMSVENGVEVINQTLPNDYPKYGNNAITNMENDVFYLLNGKVNKYDNSAQSSSEVFNYDRDIPGGWINKLLFTDENRLFVEASANELRVIDTQSSKSFSTSDLGLEADSVYQCGQLVVSQKFSYDTETKMNFHKWNGSQYTLKQSIGVLSSSYDVYHLDNKNAKFYYLKAIYNQDYVPKQTLSIYSFDCQTEKAEKLYSLEEDENTQDIQYLDNKIIFSSYLYGANGYTSKLQSLDLNTNNLTILHDDYSQFNSASMFYTNKGAYHFKLEDGKFRFSLISNNTSTELSSLNISNMFMSISPFTLDNDPKSWIFLPVTLLDGLLQLAVYMPEYDRWHTIKIPNVYNETTFISQSFYLDGHYYFPYESYPYGYEMFTVNQNCLVSQVVHDEQCKTPYENRPPIMLNIDSPTLEANQYLYIPTRAWDEDMDKLTYSISQTPSWVKFNSENGEIYGQIPADFNTNIDNIIVTVSDGTQTTSSLPFSINIKTDDGGDGNTDTNENDGSNETDLPTPDNSDKSGSSGGTMFVEMLLIILVLLSRQKMLINYINYKIRRNRTKLNSFR
ncbi:hypothetical protein H5123_01670 [Shewanella sp. SR43-4]|uniref:putative Ig domain-containing protein n=1 Tax=Shewanella sp. SR43-4 TaxID=2760942 RepID=UPI0015FD64A9|nr:putative Ig domain-containing protein [Shewanella sp. SR43-4]MBB1316356.1 hypothetical protein [Shewanella sp. SR43-4]